MRNRTRLGIAGAGAVVTFLTTNWFPIRHRMGGWRSQLIQSGSSSPQFHHRHFHNHVPATRPTPKTVARWVGRMIERPKDGKPVTAVHVCRPKLPNQPAELAVTWLGHASTLLEVDGHWVLLDPMFSRRASPSGLCGPRRLHPSPVQVTDLPDIDAVVISHDHYDHLDTATIKKLARTTGTRFVVPLGVGAHLRRWGIPDNRIDELDWDCKIQIRSLSITCTPARHFSGRTFARNTTLWASWVIAGPTNRVFFGGDSGYSPDFAEIGRAHGPFELTVMPIGAYDQTWPDVHMTPEEAVDIHRQIGGKRLLPVHWGTFDLAFHPYAEPMERLQAAAADIDIVQVTIGQRTEL